MSEQDRSPARGGWATLLDGLDDMMTSNPWYPRVMPYLVYLLFLDPIRWLGELSPATFPVVYVVQIAVVVWLLYRYRRWLPELNVRFHWLAVVTAVAMVVGWVGLRYATDAWWPRPAAVVGEKSLFEQMGPGVFALSVGLKFVGMGIVVPLFEELFVRSAILRGTHSAKQTAAGLVQFLEELPLLGDWLMHTRLGHWAGDQPAAFTDQLERTAVGALSLFGVVVSTAVFALGHTPRDYAGAVLSGVTWCGLLWYTNRGGRKLGLGPVVWSHGLTNVLLLGYVLWSGDWQFMV